jgi:23S rRNA (guanosine2251-2'-O)-methyltransferase
MKKLPAAEGEIWISGVNPVREALLGGETGGSEVLLARSDPRGQEIAELAARRGIPVTRSDRERLSELAGHSHHQGVALRMAEFPYADLDGLLEKPLGDRDPLVILDSIQDPRNLGAILRSACFLGAKAVVIPADRSARVGSAVIKVAAGAAVYVPVARVTNIVRTLQRLKSAGYWAAGLDAGGGKASYEADFTVPLCLVIGNEQKGIRPLVRKECDLLVRIPSAGPLDSLNAASAASIALYEVLRQRLTVEGKK